MALTRGLKGLFPCPVCLVPTGEQADLSGVYPIRTARQSQSILEGAKAFPFAYQSNDLLKSVGLRGVEVSPLHSYMFVKS
jgi:hypothetical protein